MTQQIKTLIVDDSAFARSIIVKKLSVDPDIEIIGVAKDGVDALEKIKDLKPNVVTLDVSMPRMDGLTALEKIMAECPTPVVMLSALTAEQAPATIAALELGAVDFFLKPSVLNPAGVNKETGELAEKVKIAARIDVSKPRRKTIKKPATSKPIKSSRVAEAKNKIDVKPNVRSSGRSNRNKYTGKVLVIGSSTGGPKALSELIPELPSGLPVPVLVVQHMPPGFTRSFAERLNQVSALNVKEAEAGDVLEVGTVLLAPGDHHMVVTSSGRIALNQEPPVWGVRPSVDVTMDSVVDHYGGSTLGVVLTGMGSDGSNGTAAIKAKGGSVAVEHESTCAIYGMPRCVVEQGNADKVLPLPDMAEEIIRMCGN
ncbi:MAG: chemotaxis response regulator protein-glutamate methylesterase [Chloroflexi bacterium]|nr:chemotaxis response regulator protein-glutamate methylesterase [Chloroflexota bacterium]